MKQKYVVGLCLIILGIIFFSWYSFSNVKGVVEIRKVGMELVVSDKIGVVVNDSILDFGVLVPGSSIQRELSLSNTNNFDLEVLFSSQGNISSFVKVNDFILNSYETIQVPIIVLIPENSSLNFYSGELQVVFRRV